MSSHMNQNRCWPGVPNTYSTRSLASEMRPKSMATVVDTLFGVAATSSTPTLAVVITASVRSGVISDMAPTNVVLPTPNPPATTIFAEVIRLREAPLLRAKSTEHPLDQLPALVQRGVPGQRRRHLHQPVREQVGHQHLGHPERNGQVRGHLRDRAPLHAQPRDCPQWTRR